MKCPKCGGQGFSCLLSSALLNLGADRCARRTTRCFSCLLSSALLNVVKENIPEDVSKFQLPLIIGSFERIYSGFNNFDYISFSCLLSSALLNVQNRKYSNREEIRFSCLLSSALLNSVPAGGVQIRGEFQLPLIIGSFEHRATLYLTVVETLSFSCLLSSALLNEKRTREQARVFRFSCLLSSALLNVWSQNRIHVG